MRGDKKVVTGYHFFQALDLFMHQKVYTNADQVENPSRQFVDSRDQTFYRNGINALLNRWQHCADANGSYFELKC